MWKVLGRDDYAHKSQELKKKCEELAKAICDKLIELDMTEIFIPRCGITFRVITVQISCVKRILLALKSGNIYYLLASSRDMQRTSTLCRQNAPNHIAATTSRLCLRKSSQTEI